MLSIHTTPNRQEDTGLWWQDCYDEIAEHGYQLRPRLHVVKEDGQHTMVRAGYGYLLFLSLRWN